MKERVSEKGISVIVPTFNEADSITFVLQDLNKLSQTLPGIEIIVVDSASIDGTKEIVEEVKKIAPDVELHPVDHMSYGATLLTGIKYAHGDIIVTFDGDGAYDANDILKLIQPLRKGQADLVLGSRYLGERRPGSISYVQQLGDRLLGVAFRMISGLSVVDLLTTLRASKKETLEKLDLRAQDLSSNAGLMSKAVSRRLIIAEVPVTYRPRLRPRARLADGFRILSRIIKEAISHE